MSLNRTANQYADLDPSGYDYLLIAISGALTSYAAGAAVANTIIGWIFVVLTLLGVWISYAVMRAIQGTKIVAWNGFVYTGGVLAAFFSARSLMEMLPDNPFTAQIFVCGLLLWMLAFGSYLIWSDQTLLFQAVPSIAIFGLVGCYDTYRHATWLFFGFLLCFATLLARVHSRTMLKQAKDSGYSQVGDRMDRSATELERMQSGPWKWVAGPQWALGSAFVVILFSLISAPIVQTSVQGVAGAVNVQAPIAGRSTPTFSTNSDPSGLRVGQGPNQVSKLPVFRATLDRPRYMRTAIYQAYTPNGWASLSAQAVGDKTNDVLSRSNDRLALTSLTRKKMIDFEIEPIQERLLLFPIPGEILSVQPADNTSIKQDATITIVEPGKVNVYRGRSAVAEDAGAPKEAIRELPAGMEVLLAPTNISPAVFDLANRVSESGKTDYERALLVKREIESRVRYNLDAAAIPAGKDPVEAVLFETKEGYCDLFASSMTLMARSIGIPARMVVGYYPLSDDSDGDGRYVVKEADKHAWAELFFKDHGWVVFDATEGAASVPGAERGSSNTESLADSAPVKLAIDVLIGLAVVAILVLTGRTLFRTFKHGPNRSDLDRAYLAFADVLAKASGKVRNFDQTPSEYVRESMASLNGSASQAMALNAKFERLFYSPADPSREDLKQIQAEIAALRSSVKAERKVA